MKSLPWLVVAALGGCDAPAEQCEPTGVDVSAQAIVGGSAQSGLLRLDEGQRRAIVQLATPDASAGDAALCTATLVREDWAVSAAHCARDELPLAWTGSGEAREALDVVEAVAHTDADLWLLRLDGAQVRAAGIAPLVVMDVSIEAEQEGEAVELAGYGATSAQGSGAPALRFVVEPIADVDSLHIDVDGSGRSGACNGDSGGPLLLRRQDGRAAVAGVLSRGSPSCTGLDRYTHLASHAAWLSDLLGPEPSAVGCEGLDATGECALGSAAWCEGSAIRSAACSADQVCGWSATDAGYRCVAPADDACTGTGRTGACDGDVALSCVDGAARGVDCASCNARCGRSSDDGSAQCVRIVSSP